MDRWGGIALLGVAVVAFGLQNNLSKLSYSYGVSVLTLLSLRTWIIVAALLVWLLVARRTPLMPRSTWPALVWVGLLFAGGATALLTAIQLIPVSLAILAFYIFPIFVGLLSAALGEDRLSPVTVTGLLVAFAGLALALNVEIGGALVDGLAFALVAALCMAFNIIGSGRLMRSIPGAVVTFNMMAVAGVALAAATVADGGLHLPQGGATGWAVFLGASILAPVSLVSVYLALEFVSGTRASMMMNGEPVLTVLFAVLLFGEAFTAVQTLGAVMVIGAIVVVTLKRPPGPA
jgi:drug/metabolite transporter (DMT)-like permease